MTAGPTPIRTSTLRPSRDVTSRSPAVARPIRERLLRPTLPELWTFLALALPVFAALLATLPTVDLAYQLRAGVDMLAGQGIPATDTWTFTAAGRPWLDQQWGAQVLLAAAFEALGWTGLAVLRAALVGLVSGLILLAVRRRAPDMRPRTAALLTLAAFVVTSPALALRPQLIGMVLFAATLLILAGRRRWPDWLWLIPVVGAAWANVHGSFILAPILVGLAWLEDLHDRSPRAGRTLLISVATGAATLATPFGIGAWQYALGIATNRQVTSRISEWQPPTLVFGPGLLFWVSVTVVAAAAVVLARRRGGIPWPALLTLVGFAALGAIAERGIAWWPGVAVVTLAGLAAGRLPAAADPAEARRRHHGIVPGAEDVRPARGSGLNALVGAILLAACVALIPAWRPVDPGLNAPSGLLGQAPSGVTAALRGFATPHDRVWNPQVWGSWLEFAVPAPTYAFDARIELIPSAAWANGDTVAAAGAGWPAILDTAGVTIVVVEEPGTSSLEQALAESAGWERAHADAEGSIWIRADR